LAATHKELREQCRVGGFREDLYYRLAVVTIGVPSLRQRPGDVPLLARHFMKDYVARTGRPIESFDPSALDALTRRPWPGNVRELRNILERTFIFAQGPNIHAMDLPEEILDAPGSWYESRPEDLNDLHFHEAKQMAVEAFEQCYLRELLERTGGNISRAAREAGMDRSNFRRLMKKLGV
jgi:DNA-binding NtrC family response regulator